MLLTWNADRDSADTWALAPSQCLQALLARCVFLRGGDSSPRYGGCTDTFTALQHLNHG